MGLVKTNIPGLMKDEKSGLIQNTNLNDLAVLKAQQRKSLEFNNLKDQVEQMKISIEKILNHLKIEE